jgi:ketosteroid isomerase-like protein
MSGELEQAERDLADAVRARDASAAAELLDDEFVLTSSLGTGLRVPKDAWLANLGAIETTALEARDLQARALGDTGVVVWLMDWRARWGDDDLSGEYVVSDVWRRNGGWRLVWRSWARLNAELGR